MHRRNFGNSSGVIVDICSKDGVWFDDGEFAQVVAFCASGEFDKAEKAERLRLQARQDRENFERQFKQFSSRRYYRGLGGAMVAAEVFEGLGDAFIE